ncbi:MAG: cytochrome d ubiquinol oxidase subunit II [Terricaulis sp.]|nr:cytochrome d ubiquinol oxidase subunit II [Terricaulis sp.]
MEIGIPGIGSWFVTGDANAELHGLEHFAKADRPPVWITFWAFRVMVAMGMLMVLLGVWGVLAWALKRLDRSSLYHWALVAAGPSGFIAVLAGWVTAEVGRQPYVVYGVLRTADAVSPVSTASVATSLLFFMIVYAIVFSAGALYILRLMAKGPESDEPEPHSNQPPGTPLGARDRGGVSMFGLELSVIWAVLIAVAVFLYVALDGFDLGVGILFPFAKDARERDQMQASIAPVWDGNETWLVLGGGGLFAAFPKAYAALMPALYAPIILMLLALIFRGVAFEFRHHARGQGKRWWTIAFAGGSIVATIAQGLVLGGFIQGVNIENGVFVGGSLDWLTPFSLLVAAALVAGYALLGAAWLVFKAQGALYERARAWVTQLALLTALAMGAVSLATLGVDPRVTERWGLTMTSVDWPVFMRVAPLPLLAGLVCFLLWRRWSGQPHLALICSAWACSPSAISASPSACIPTSSRSR